MLNLFREQVIKHSDKIALSEPVLGKTVTYKQLDGNARCIASKLNSIGIRHGEAVIITAARGIGYIEAMFGILMAGGAYVPLSDTYPTDRVAYIQNDCGAKIIVDDTFINDAYSFEPVAEICEIKPEDTALIIYTSGSTGKPKGVVHDHEAVKGSVLRYSSIMDFKDDDIYGIGCTFYFILSVVDIYTGLINGITEIVIPNELKGDPEGLADFIDRHKITSTVIMPKVLRYFTPKSSSLCTVMTCGERVSQIAPNGYRLLNCYGMTELAGEGLTFNIDKAYDNTPIGKPCGNVNVYLLDESGNDSDEGEICFAGHFGKGYLNRPEETAKVFTQNPFKNIDGHNMLIRTGDLGRRLPDGNILYLNRMDWMLKINGQRVEPGEIEAAVRELDGIKETAVKDFTDTTGQIFLAAYYISDVEKNEKELKNALSVKLPEYMVPNYFVRLEKLPVNTNGKLDRAALPKPNIDLSRAEYAAPENDRQAAVVEAFESVLGIEKIGINDNFFSLGGDSIKVIVLQKALREKGIEISASSVFNAQTPKLLSETAVKASGLSSYKGEKADSYPLTRAQMSIYLDCQLPDKATAYNNVFSLFLPNDMAADELRLKNAVETVLNGYPILGAKIAIVDGVPSLVPSYEKITAEIKETESTDKNALAASINKPFDLENDLPTRAVIFKTPEGLMFIAVMHHIICDGTTASIVIGNIAAAYNGEPLAREEMSNFTLAQYEAAHPEITQADNEVYRQMLDNIDSDTELYNDDTPELAKFKGKLGVYDTSLFTQRQELSGKLATSLNKNRLTESTLFMSAYAYMLRLFCNQKNVLFFTGENGRHDPVLQNTVGMMVHNLPVAAHIDENIKCVDFMSDMQNSFHKLVKHDNADISQLCSEYGIHPDCFFVYQGDMLSGVNIDDRYIPMEIYVSEDVMTSLTLHVLKQNSGDYALKFEYAAEKISAETVKRMAEVYAMIVEGLCDGGKLGDIRLVTDENIAEMERFNQTEADYPVTNIVSLFREQAEKNPDRAAVFFKGKTLTYKQVDDISERIANKIRSLGLGKGDVVSILIPRCEYMTTASLGALKSGAAYQPLDPTYPTERLTFMMSDADAKLLIADEALLEKVPEYKGEILLTKDIPELPECKKIEKDPEPSDLLILLYTSGSTGTPKGVMIEHRNLANFCAWYRDFYKLDENSRVTAYASYGFDANMMDMYPALTTGACVYIIEDEIRLDLPALESYINQNDITHAFMTTQVGRQFYAMTAPEKLKYLSTGGEKLVPLEPKKDGLEFYNLYGPTECTIVTTAQQVDRLYERLPIGKPLNNYKCYVIDENGRRLPPLIPGELLISGRGVARGYLNRPDLTEKAFIQNPFCKDEDYSRAYRSGDIVRLLPDGKIDFIGRNDGQVKVRGFRVELTEVEGVIRSFDGIEDATVQAFEDKTSGEKFIAAYIVSKDKVDISALNAFILAQKPPYMVPAVTMQIESIPLNQNQKVDKRALPAPVFTDTSTDDAAVNRPLTYFESEIVDVLKKALGDIEIKPYVSLVRYGLTSISAIGVMAMLHARFDVQIPIAKLLEGISVSDIGDIIFREWDKRKTEGSDEQKTAATEKLSKYPLSSVQHGVYYDAMKRETETLYNIPMCFEFEHIDEKRLANALILAVKAHSYLNTHIEFSNGELVQMRCDDIVPSVEIKTLSSDEFDVYKNSFVRSFDLGSGPLYRFEIVKANNKTYLFMDIHHIIFDGFSVNVFLHDVSEAYLGKEPESEKYTYFEYALDDKEYIGSESYKKSGEYFEKMLCSFDAPTDIMPDISGDAENGKAAQKKCAVSKDMVDAYCRENAVTQSSVFLAGVFYTLSRFTASKDVLISTISSGRSDVKLNKLVGMFVHTIPLAMHFNKDMTANELISASADAMRSSVANEDYPFAELAAKYGYSTNIMYECQIGIIDNGGDIGGEKYETIPLSLETPKFNITFAVVEENDSYVIYVRYNDELYSAEYMEKLAECAAVALNGLISAPDKFVKTLSLLPAGEKEKIDKFGKGLQSDVPIKLLHKLFEDTAQKNADKTALIACDRTLTFSQLDKEANIIANGLIKRGINKGSGVVLLLPRKSFYFAALFGVLKSGCAFIPCDPEYPSDRINHIITDSNASFIVTTSDKLSAYPSEKALDIKDLLAGKDTSVPDVDVSPNDLAYMIYTSGSTGNPKGVMLRHIGICNYIGSEDGGVLYKTIRTQTETMVSVTTVSFDLSFKDTVGVLCSGKAVVFTDEQQMNDPRKLADILEKTGGDSFSATPSRLMQYMEYEPFKNALGKCRLVLFGGEPCPKSLLNALKALGIPKFINSYGPTEITVSSNAADLTDSNKVNVGKPLPNYTEYITDIDGNLVPVGVMGELLIGGPGVSAGYVGLPEKNAASFIDYNGERVYRSGDYAKWDSDGNVYILGRIDSQVKLRGLRIEPSEIEELMEKQPHINRAVVTVRKLNGQDNLCAYFTSDTETDIKELHDALAAKLTHYMVPASFTQLDKIPVTPNGKVDLRALPEPTLFEKGEYTAPADNIEKFFCDLFAKVLDLDKVGANDDFFGIGGTSLSATSIMIGASDNGYKLSYGDIFKYKTPRLLSALFKEKSSDKGSGKLSVFDDYDYSKINKLLARNTLESFSSGNQREIGNILLTGATGYMGVHVLAEYLRSEAGTAWCIVRKGRYNDPMIRLKNILHYYFGDEFDSMYDRIKVINGDVTAYAAFEALEKEKIDTIFNCAANVKHFSDGTDIEDINVGGAANCVRFCKKTGARLIHFSTTSVNGAMIVSSPDEIRPLDEKTMYFGQILDNQYTSSKMLAERTVFEAAAERNLDAKVIRVGTLAARESDGEFQVNYLSNSFMERLRSYVLLKCFPYSRMDEPMRLGPIDISAKAFMQLAKTPKECCLFNAVNTHSIPAVDVIRVMKDIGLNIRIVEDKVFDEILTKAGNDPKKAAILSSLLAYKTNTNLAYVPVKFRYTSQILARMGFFWNITDASYIHKFIEGMAGLGFFDENNFIR